MGLEIGGSAVDDAVEIGRELLRFLQPLTAAGGAAIPIRIARTGAIELLGDGFRRDGHVMHGAVGEIGELFRMTHREARAAANVACVGARCGESPFDAVGERTVAHGAVPTAVADGLEIVVPAGCRKPNFDLDVGVRGWLQGRHHAAELRQGFERRQVDRKSSRRRGRWCEGARRNALRPR